MCFRFYLDFCFVLNYYFFDDFDLGYCSCYRLFYFGDCVQVFYVVALAVVGGGFPKLPG